MRTGPNTPIRDAASSMASGMPSSAFNDGEARLCANRVGREAAAPGGAP